MSKTGDGTVLGMPMEDRFREYLGDESGWKGSAEGLALPESPEEAADTLASAFRKGVPVTVQGGRTGVCGGAVPQGGLLMGLRGLDQVLGLEELTGGGWGMRVQAGVSLAEIQRRSGRYFWPSDPTETTAAVGGILSVGARGPLGHFYGDPRQYVEELRAADSRGRIRTLRRGESSIAGFLEEAASSLPYPVLAQGLKPLGLTPEDDSVDLFLGTEGILGVILETVLRLRPAPAEAWGIGFFFPDSRRAADFSEALKEVSPEGGDAVLAAAEFLDTPSLAYAEGMRGQAAKLKGLPPVHPGWGGMAAVEIHGGQEEAVIGLAERLMGLAEAFGCGEEDTWALSEPGEAEKLRLFRHAVPEGINQAVERVSRRDPRIVKMVFDGSCPGIPLGEAAARYRREADDQGVPAAVFGPIRENRLQVNLIPEDHAAYRRAGALMDRWQAEAGQAGGDPFGVYGIGKLRAEGFRRRLSQEEFRALGALKGAADPGGRLNQGTLWADPEGAG